MHQATPHELRMLYFWKSHREKNISYVWIPRHAQKASDCSSVNSKAELTSSWMECSGERTLFSNLGEMCRALRLLTCAPTFVYCLLSLSRPHNFDDSTTSGSSTSSAVIVPDSAGSVTFWRLFTYKSNATASKGYPSINSLNPSTEYSTSISPPRSFS